MLRFLAVATIVATLFLVLGVTVLAAGLLPEPPSGPVLDALMTVPAKITPLGCAGGCK